MKIWLYKGGLKLIFKSGIGKAFEHQRAALEEKEIDYSTKFNFGYDLVQINTIFPDSLIVAVIAKLMRKKVIYYAHSTMEDFRNSFKGSNFFAAFFKRWIKLCYSMGDVVITPTEYSKNLLEGYGINRKIISLTNGIDLKYYKKDAELGKQFRDKYHFNEKDKVVISVGHYIERKGIEDFAALAERLPEYQFLWFGYTNLNLVPCHIRSIINAKLPNLHFPGYISSEELKAAYSGSDLFLFLTHEETEGIVLLEALAMKIPILIRDIPIYESWFQKGKQVYKGRGLAEFKVLTKDILEGKIPDLTEEGYKTVQEKSLSKVGDTLMDTYTEVLNPTAGQQENMEKGMPFFY